MDRKKRTLLMLVVLFVMAVVAVAGGIMLWNKQSAPEQTKVSQNLPKPDKEDDDSKKKQTYKILVKNAKGSPIQGIIAAFYDQDGNVIGEPGTTNNLGAITVKTEDANIAGARVLAVPYEYELNRELYELGSSKRTISIVLNDNPNAYMAQIGDQKLTFADAIEKANASETDVTIKLLGDVHYSQSFILNNVNGKTITLDGQGYTLNLYTTTHSIRIYQKTGTVNIQNMKIEHGGFGNLVLVGTNENQSLLSKNAVNVNLTNLDIESDSAHAYTLINTKTMQTINMNITDMNLVWKNAKEVKGGAIMPGISGMEQVLNLTIKDSVIDVRQANGAKGISAANKVTGEINLINTKILTSNGAKPVSKGKMNFTRDAASYLNDGTPDEAKIGDTIYNKLSEAIEAANKSETDVTITLLADAKVEKHILFENANGKNIVLDGAGHTLTVATSGHSMYVHQKTGTVDIKNMKIVHSGTGNVLRIGKRENTELSEDLVTVNLTNLDIHSSSTHEYTLIHTNESQKIDLNMSKVNLVWETEREGIKGGAIMASVSGLKQELNLTMKDCIVDVTKANGAKGIQAENVASGNINLYNTVIKTMKTEAVENDKMVLVIDKATTFDNGTADEVAIGAVKYNTLEEALLDANASTTDVNITMLRDMEIYESIIVNNVNGKNIVLDGAGHKVTAVVNAHTIQVNQKAGTFNLSNMDIVHGGTGCVIRIGDRNATYTEKLTVNLDDLGIASESSCEYGLIQAGYGTMELDLNMTDVDLAWETNAEVQKGAIFAGLSGETTKLNLTMTDCNIDASKVVGAYGISAERAVTGNLVLNDTTITSNKTSVFDQNMKFTRNEATVLSTYPTTQVQIGDVVYNELSEAVADANKSDKDVTISFLSDEVPLKSDIKIENVNGKKITVDGCGKTLVSNKSILVNQKSGTVDFINTKVEHSGSGPVLSIGEKGKDYSEKLTVNLNNLDIESTSTQEYRLIHAGNAAMTLDLNMTDVDLVWNTETTVEKGAIMAGVSGLETVLNLTMTDCNIDTSQADGAYGISAERLVTGNLVLNNTTITSNKDSVFDQNMKFTRNEATVLSTYPTTQVQIGDVIYNELGEAIADANNSQEDVTISFLSDEVTFKESITIQNVNGKKITIDGRNKTLVSNQVIFIYQENGLVEVKDMNVTHSSGNPLFRIGERGKTYSDKLTVNLNNLDIESTSTCTNGLIQAGFASMPLDLNMTDVGIVWETETAIGKGAIMAGISGAETTLNLTMTDCEINVSEANGAKAVHAENGATGNLNLINTKITTAVETPVYNNKMTLSIDKDTTFYQGTTQSVALVDGVQYSQLADAVTAMNGKTTDTTMNLVKDVTHKSRIQIYVSGNTSATITINGNGHTLTGDFKDAADTHFIYFTKHFGTVNFNNLTIEHKNTTKNLMTFGVNDTKDTTKKMTVNFKDVTMHSESTNQHAIINAAQRTNFDITLDNVTLDWETTATADATRAAIRYGNDGSGRTVTLDIKDSTLDMSGAKDSGIVYAPSGFSSESTISIENSVITPYAGQDAYKGTADDFAPAVYMQKNGYPTLADAVAVANQSEEDVTLTVLKDVTIAERITINNINGKNITLDGHGRTVTMTKGIFIYQQNGTVDVKNMIMRHSEGEPVFRIGEKGKIYSGELIVNLNNLDIEDIQSTSTCTSGLIQAGFANMTLDLNMTDVDIAWDTEATISKGAILAGNEVTTKLNLTMTGCEIDVSQANNAKAIHAESKATGEINLINTKITTAVETPVYNNKMTFSIDTDTTFYQGETQSVALVDGVQYSQLPDAVTAMNAKTTDTTMNLVKDVTIADRITINNSNGKNITLDGHGHTATMTEGIFINQRNGTVDVKNLTVTHSEGIPVFRIGDKNQTYSDSDKLTVNLNNLDIASTGPVTNGLIQAGYGTMTLDLNMTDVNIAWETETTISKGAILAGLSGKTTKLNLTMTDCEIDVSKANNAKAIHAENGVTGAIKLINTTISADVAQPVHHNDNVTYSKE